MTGIDIHAHVVPATFPASVRPDVAGWPSMEEQLAHLLQLLGDSQLMIGTDYPVAFHEKQPVDRILDTFAAEQLWDRLVYENARRFLKRGGGTHEAFSRM